MGSDSRSGTAYQRKASQQAQGEKAVSPGTKDRRVQSSTLPVVRTAWAPSYHLPR